ncbi:MAG: phosphatase PAP2 family protein [Elusimicrobia bacterium]|nr:phosphatase PAP2 family protein [Elusimicrobiota bacterium]
MHLLKRVLPLLLSLSLGGCGAKFYLLQLFGPDHHYVGSAQAVASIPAPPAPGSPQDLADIAVLRDWQTKRTADDCAAAKAQSRADYDAFFGGVSPFPDPLPDEASSILFWVYYDGSRAASAAKKKFGRSRPFLRYRDLKPCLGTVSGLAYPSGHATVSRLLARVLSDVYPPGRAEIMARADQAALNRVIGGVHHPSDIEAGKRLGDELYAELLTQDSFRADLERLKKLVVRK